MKKYLVIIFLAYASISCVREKVDPNAWKQTVKATISSTQTLVWDKNDTIALFRGNDFAAPFYVSEGIGTADGNFTRNAADPEDAKTRISTVAFYPYSKDITITAQNKITFNLPVDQVYGKKEKVLLGHVLDPEAREITLKSRLGYVHIPLTGVNDATVSSIVFKSLDNKPITGKITIGIEVGSITFAQGATSEVTLNVPNVKLSDSEPTIFELALPNHIISSGYMIVITSPDGQSMTIKNEKSITVTEDRTLKLDPIVYRPSRFGDDRVDHIVDECTIPGAYLLEGERDIREVMMDVYNEDAVYNSAGVFRIQNYADQQVLLFTGITPEKAVGEQVYISVGGNHDATKSLAKSYSTTVVKVQDDMRWLYTPGKAVLILQAED